MRLRGRWIDLLRRGATSTARNRILLTPVGLTFFALFTALFVFAAQLVYRLLDLPPLQPEGARLPVAIPLMALGGATTAWSTIHYLRVKGTPVPFYPPPESVKRGPYR